MARGKCVFVGSGRTQRSEGGSDTLPPATLSPYLQQPRQCSFPAPSPHLPSTATPFTSTPANRALILSCRRPGKISVICMLLCLQEKTNEQTIHTYRTGTPPSTNLHQPRHFSFPALNINSNSITLPQATAALLHPRTHYLQQLHHLISSNRGMTPSLLLPRTHYQMVAKKKE